MNAVSSILLSQKIYVGSYEFPKVIKKVVTFFVTKNVFSVDSVCKIKSL